MSRSIKKSTADSGFTRPSTSNSASRSSSNSTFTRPSTDTQNRQVSDHRIDAPVGKAQYITDSSTEHEVSDHRIDAPTGKWQYITDSTPEVEVKDKGTSAVTYTLVVKKWGRDPVAAKAVMNVLPTPPKKLPYRLNVIEAQKAFVFELAKKLLQAGAEIDCTKDILISFPLI